MPVNDIDTYRKKEQNLQNPDLVAKAGPQNVAKLKQDMRAFRVNNPQHFSGVMEEGIGAGSPLERLQSEAQVRDMEESEKARLQGSATAQGYNVDLSRPNVIQNLAVDPKRTAIIQKVREATRDNTLPNASKLKVFNDPPDYIPPKPKMSLTNPLAMLPTPLQRQYFYEPSVEEFRNATTDGSIARRLKKEFSLVEDLSGVSDEDLKNSTTYKAYQDAAWKHALADAMKQGYAISRVAMTKEMGGFDKAQAEKLDPAMAGANGLLAGMTGGLSRPTESPEEQRSAARNPKMSMVGEVLGTLTPTGLPARLATGSAKLLGRAGLGSRGIQGAIKGVGAGAMAGAADANIREIARFAAEALDAGDSAEEMAQRLYETVQGIPATTLRGAGMGAVMGAGGEAIGGLARAGARGIVGGQPRDILLHGQSSGVKMGGLGEPVLPKDLETMAANAAARKPNPGTADALIAEEIAPKLLNQRLAEQESATARAMTETSSAREKLGESTVSTLPLSEQIDAYAKEMPALTPEAKAKQTAIRRYARRIRREGNVSAKRIDAIMEEIDSQANQSGKDPDKDWNNVGALARGARDELQFDTPTRVDNYAIRGPAGEVTTVSDYSGMKTRQSAERTQMEVQNASMGLPNKLSPAPVRLGPAEPGAAAKLISERPDFGKVQEYFNEQRAVASDVERSDFSRPKDSTRTVSATQAQYAANKAISEAVEQGLGYQGTTYRGLRMEPESVQRLIASGKVKSDHLWSTSKDEGHALAFAKKQGGGEPVLFSIEGSSGVDLDTIPGLNTFDEVAVPTGRNFRVADSYRGKDGVLRVKLTDGTRGPQADEVSALAEGVTPKAQIPAKEYGSFKNAIIGTADPKNVVVNDMILGLAKRTGLDTEKGIRDIQRLIDAQNWKQYLGRAIQGIGSSGGTYVKMNNVLRGTPTLNSFSGGLPKMEPSKEAMDVIDRFLAEAVPSWKGLHLRGGQAARPAGARASGGDSKPRDTLTQEEAEFAAAVIKNLRDMDK